MNPIEQLTVQRRARAEQELSKAWRVLQVSPNLASAADGRLYAALPGGFPCYRTDLYRQAYNAFQAGQYDLAIDYAMGAQ